MRAYVIDGPQSGSIQTLPDPELGPYDARLHTRVCGVCTTTDAMVRRGQFPRSMTFPAVLGHESIGEVVEVGTRVRNLSVGQLVTRTSAYVAGEAPIRQYWGGFADWAVVRDEPAMVEDGALPATSPTWNQRAFSNDVDPALASLAISISESVSTARDTPLIGAHVVVIGTGVAGLGLVSWADRSGAATVTCIGRREERLAIARECGADYALRHDQSDLAAAVREHTDGGADVLFEASGDPSMVGGGAALCRPGGQVVVYGVGHGGVSVDWATFPSDVSVRVAPTRETIVYPRVLAALAESQMRADLLITHRVPFDNIAEAFAITDSGQAIKAMITFD